MEIKAIYNCLSEVNSLCEFSIEVGGGGEQYAALIEGSAMQLGRLSEHLLISHAMWGSISTWLVNHSSVMEEEKCTQINHHSITLSGALIGKSSRFNCQKADKGSGYFTPLSPSLPPSQLQHNATTNSTASLIKLSGPACSITTCPIASCKWMRQKTAIRQAEQDPNLPYFASNFWAESLQCNSPSFNRGVKQFECWQTLGSTCPARQIMFWNLYCTLLL